MQIDKGFILCCLLYFVLNLSKTMGNGDVAPRAGCAGGGQCDTVMKGVEKLEIGARDKPVSSGKPQGKVKKQGDSEHAWH